ncbi:MAG: hypothetical protein AMJ81_02065 [Phycisphaerae bacterium SM23_33]|nr:MAG: hypothetical protein AMJ81_02065 [Phycisphaerae bacterium SM23_33]
MSCPPQEHGRIAALAEGWIPTPVPGDVRQGLIAAGRMKEPLEGLNSFEGHWVEDRSWWFRKRFKVPPAMRKAQAAELVLDGLDANASIFLNGAHLGDHPSAFRPFVARVERHLRAGENVLLVRLTHGVEDVTAEQVEELGGYIPTEAGRGRPERGEPRRPFVRKPQYSWGWDWSPRTATVAIAGQPRLRLLNQAVLRDVRVRALPRGRDVTLQVRVQAEWLDFRSSGGGRIEVAVYDPDGKLVQRRRVEGMLQIGDNYFDVSVPVGRARLWWPAGMGRQDRYTIQVTLRAGGGAVDRRSLSYGIRFLELETDDRFALRVNGVRMFSKGGDWIPPDALYARVTDQKLDRLVVEAARANFNMLRIWGGGRYEPEAFYEACDREGILVWHDFMLCCAPYPDHLESFRDEIAKEADYQTRRLRNHACVAVCSGSNECHYFLDIGGPRETDKVTRLLGRVLPEAVHRNCPEIPYWYSSPAGGKEANDPQVGDCHYWHVMMHADINVRITPESFDNLPVLFVSEFGYPGPCGRATTEQYLAGAPFDRTDKVWQHHNNTFEQDTVDAGIARHYADPAGMSPQEYLLYGGLTQGLMLGYELEALRANPRCHGGLFWMYNDCWGEVGWTILDYYLRRKISWYFVRRALAHRRLILRASKGRIRVTLANDTARPAAGRLEYGYVSLDGSVREVRRRRFSAAASARTVVATFGRGRRDPKAGLWFARVLDDRSILPATLRAAEPRDLPGRPKVYLSVQRTGRREYKVILRSRAYARAVELRLPAGAVPDDNYFELLPGVSRTIRVAYRGRLSWRNVSATAR